MKIRFGSDEWYPVFHVLGDKVEGFYCDLEVELTDEELKDFRETYEKFEKWQRRLFRLQGS